MQSSRSDTPTSRILCFGETMALFEARDVGDLASARSFTRRIAGADSNVAIGLTRLGFDVRWVSRVGKDTLGRFIIDQLESEGLNCDLVRCDDGHATGMQFKERRDDGQDPATEYFRRQSAASFLEPDDIPAQTWSGIDHLHCTGIPPALSPSCRALTHTAMEAARANGCSLSFDPNLRPALWPSREHMIAEINALAAKADWVLPGLAEGRILTGRTTPEDIAAFYLDRGAQEVVIKLGTDGAYWQSASARHTAPAHPVAQVVDTVGAGDGFAVGYISGRLEKLAIEQVLDRANAIGARVVQTSGDSEGLPHRDFVDTL